MNDSEFMEILNLYLDHEVSAADSARLEAEVMTNPHRRRIYRQYCRMHKACVLLGDQTARKAPAWEAKKPAAFGWRPRGWNAGIYAGGLLAAACVTMIVVVRMHPAATAPAAPRAAVQSVGIAASPPVASAALRAPDRLALQPVFTTRALATLVDTSRTAQMPSPELNDQFAWMNRIQLAPIQGTPIESAMFEPTPVLLDADNRAIGPAQLSPTQAERAAFQFQR